MRRHSRGDEAQAATRQWVHRLGLIRSEGTLRKFDALGYGRPMSYAAPDARDEDLRLLVDWNTLFFVFASCTGPGRRSGSCRW